MTEKLEVAKTVQTNLRGRLLSRLDHVIQLEVKVVAKSGDEKDTIDYVFIPPRGKVTIENHTLLVNKVLPKGITLVKESA